MFSFFKKRKQPQKPSIQIAAETVCDYILMQIDQLTAINFLPSSVWSSLVLHSAFYAIISDLLVQFEAEDFFISYLNEKLQQFDNPSGLLKVYKLYSDNYKRHYTVGKESSVSFTLWMAESDAFEKDSPNEINGVVGSPLDRWLDYYETPFVDTAKRIIGFTSDLFEMAKK